MIEPIQKTAWIMLALIHAAPAAAAFAPALVRRLYRVDPSGDLGVLLVHRGVLFLAVLAVALLAVFDAGARRAASLVVAISVVGFLLVYLRAGAPAGPLRSIALVDAAALIPLAVVLWAAWRG
jgi:hypothetical protein